MKRIEWFGSLVLGTLLAAVAVLLALLFGLSSVSAEGWSTGIVCWVSPTEQTSPWDKPDGKMVEEIVLNPVSYFSVEKREGSWVKVNGLWLQVGHGVRFAGQRYFYLPEDRSFGQLQFPSRPHPKLIDPCLSPQMYQPEGRYVFCSFDPEYNWLQLYGKPMIDQDGSPVVLPKLFVSNIGKWSQKNGPREKSSGSCWVNRYDGQQHFIVQVWDPGTIIGKNALGEPRLQDFSMSFVPVEIR